MAAVTKNHAEDTKQAALSPKLKGRGTSKMTDKRRGVANGRMTENAKDTLCRNVTIYGKCRYEDKGILLHDSAYWVRHNPLTRSRCRLCLQPHSREAGF